MIVHPFFTHLSKFNPWLVPFLLHMQVIFSHVYIDSSRPACAEVWSYIGRIHVMWSSHLGCYQKVVNLYLTYQITTYTFSRNTHYNLGFVVLVWLGCLFCLKIKLVGCYRKFVFNIYQMNMYGFFKNSHYNLGFVVLVWLRYLFYLKQNSFSHFQIDETRLNYYCFFFFFYGDDNP